MANQRLIYGFHAVNARLWQNPKSITELYVQEGKNDARTRDVLEKAANENVRVYFAIAIAITTRCESCISVHAAAAAQATESEPQTVPEAGQAEATEPEETVPAVAAMPDL